MKQKMKQKVAVLIAMIMTVLTIVNPYASNTAKAAAETTTIYFVDNTKEKWVGNKSACMELVDNTNKHKHYTMKKVEKYVWSVVVPVNAKNLTFNRLNPQKTKQWNSWSAGGRKAYNTYFADAAECGHYGNMKQEVSAFEVGDTIYLDVSKYLDWSGKNADMYINFNAVSRKDNGGESVSITAAGSKFLALDLVDDQVEEHIYKFTVTEEFAGKTVLRFWRGNSNTLWNNSIALKYSDYESGKNCVCVTGWNDSGYLTKYTENDRLDIDTKTDTDKDQVPDCLEEKLGTNKKADDTDNDGLSDYEEIYKTGTDPINIDTDNDGINDGDEDCDGDGLTNLEEHLYGTDVARMDTDGDDLSDYDEIKVYKTNPLKEDTDKDCAQDGIEVSVGTDPLVAEESFVAHKKAECEDTVVASVDIELSAEQISSLSVEKYEDELFFPEQMPGYLGGCYEFSVEGSFEEAKINFEFDKELLNDKDFDPVIYYFNEEEQKLEALDTTIDGNVASAKTPHFSKYILVNRTVYEDSLTWQDTWTSSNYTDVEIVLVIDDSGSMTSNDRYNQRLSVAQTLVDNLPQSSKVGVVKFTSSTNILTSALTSQKEEAKSYLTGTYFRSSGGTYMYSAINSALGLFQSKNDTTLRMMVVLSDGVTSDTSKHSSTISAANSKGVKIYSVGLGASSSSYFTNYMKPLANNTGGAFYLASNASELATIYKDITEKIDIETDSDADGISDYYEDNMIMFNGVTLVLDKNNPDTDGDGLKDGEEVCDLIYEYNEDKTKVRVTGRIISDPTEKDSDYDGIPDDKDEKKLSGKFSGKMISYYDVKDATYTFDYRQFFDTSTSFDDSISTSSLIFANAIYDEMGFSYKEGNSGEITSIEDLLKLHGFENVKDYKLDSDYSDDDISEIGIGYHNVEYKGEKISVLAVVIRGTNGTIEEWSSNVDLGDPEVWSSDRHKGFDTTTQRIMKYVKKYVQEQNAKMESKVVYWVTGHSRGAAIANLLSADLIDSGNTVFAYTYASPGTTVSASKNDTRYSSIFNLKNESDIVTCVPLPQWDFGTYGKNITMDVATSGIEAEWCEQTGRSKYNAFSKSLLEVLTNRLYKNCASTWSEAYDYAGDQNIDDDQYNMISERAKRYCKLEERKSLILKKHKGYKLYPSTIFMFQLGMEIYAGSDQEKKNALDLLPEFINSKFAWAIVLLLGEAVWDGLPENLDESMVGDGHAPASYYLLIKKYVASN